MLCEASCRAAPAATLLQIPGWTVPQGAAAAAGLAHAVTLRCSWCWPHDPEIQGREDGWTFADGVLFLNQYHRLRNPNVSAPSACAVGLRRRPAPAPKRAPVSLQRVGVCFM